MIEATVYYVPTCPECHDLIRLLDNTEGVSLTKLDMTNRDDRADALISGMCEVSMPVLTLNGGEFIPRRFLVEEGKGLKIQVIQKLIDRIKEKS